VPLRVPVGVVDRPFEQRRDPLLVDLDGGGGHVAVVGKPQSGKSTAIRTLLAALALTHPPTEVQFYCLDFSTGSLRTLAGLPHTGGVATRQDTELVRRTVVELASTLDTREREFTERGITTMAEARQLPGSPYPDLFLVVDGWQVMQQEFEPLDQLVGRLAARGLGYGIHVILSGNRWMEIRPAMRDLLGTRIELRLGEPFESEVNRRAAGNVPENSPGRGITREALHCLIALPTVDDSGTAGLVDAVRRRWPETAAPPVRTLPRSLPASSLPSTDGAGLPIGLDEEQLGPVRLDFDAEAHLTILGQAESGRTNLLRLIGNGVVARYTPREARLLVVDYRRTLLDAFPAEHLVGYAASAEALRPMVADVAFAMRERLPGPDLTADQLRSRGWWRGSRLFLLVDDYDLVESTEGDPLHALVDLLGHGADIGLHLILARATGGAGRALLEPVLRRLRDAGNPGILLAGPPEEGPLLGAIRPRALPPGRGILVSRRLGTRTVQTALAPQTG
jgi:S-DNA-T family DNA segregation ATPase FtsK/SpoIIIE